MNTFATERRFSAPPAAVFAALADPARLARWWGPAGFTNRFAACDFRPGGKWTFDMIGPDGTVYPNTSVFERIEPGRLVVIRHLCPPQFTLTLSLEPAPGGALLRWVQVFDDEAVARAVAHVVVPSNEQNLDRLAAEVRRSPA